MTQRTIEGTTPFDGDATLGRVAAFRLAILTTAIGVFAFAAGPFAGIPGSMLAAFAGAGLAPRVVAEIESATHKSWPLGSEAFRRNLVKLTARRLEPAKRGRPRKELAAAKMPSAQAEGAVPAAGHRPRASARTRFTTS